MQMRPSNKPLGILVDRSQPSEACDRRMKATIGRENVVRQSSAGEKSFVFVVGQRSLTTILRA